MARFVLSPEALNDLDEIWLSIAIDNISAAERNEQRLRSAMGLLSEQPGIGHARTDLTDQPVKFWPVGDYLIVYDPAKHPIQIARVLHGFRDLTNIL